MKSREIRELRCRDLLSSFLTSYNCIIFLTLTTPDVCDIVEIRRRWRNLRHWIVEHFPGIKYVMNFEVHPGGHGWHIHSVFTGYISLNRYLSTIRSYGFGRVNIKRVDNFFVADYLTKHCMKAYRGCNCRGNAKRIRLVNQSRCLPVLSDYFYRSDLLVATKKMFISVKAQMPYFSPFLRSYWSSLPFRSRFSLCSIASLLDVSSFSFDSFLRLVISHKIYKNYVD